jgi:hypothetical protein
MCILNDSCVVEVHPEGVAHPAKSLLDLVGALACFVQEDTSPNSKQVRGIFPYIFGAYPRVHLLDRLSNESGFSPHCQVH